MRTRLVQRFDPAWNREILVVRVWTPMKVLMDTEELAPRDVSHWCDHMCFEVGDAEMAKEFAMNLARKTSVSGTEP